MNLTALRTAKRAFLRVVALGLLVQGISAWMILFGVTETVGFDDLTVSERNLVIVQAVACPIAMAGTWFAVDWGAVLWGVVVLSLFVAFVLDAPDAPIVVILLLVHSAALLLWCTLAWRTRRSR